MKTKYDWSNVPSEVLWIATEKDGSAFGHKSKPVCFDLNFRCGWVSAKYDYFYIRESDNTFKGNWQDSLEERPQ